MLSAVFFLLPIVVVDVTGDRLDPAHTRKLVEHELSVTAVAPDDPRAAEATGRVEVTGDAKDKKLTVKYRKLDEPVERSIDLADDASRAEIDAAFLVGNLARDEAGELAPGPGQPRESIAESLRTNDDRTLSQLRAFVKQTSNDEKSSHLRSAVVQFTAGAALTGTAALLAAMDPKSSEVRAGAYGSAMVGGWLLGTGFVGLFVNPSPLEPIEAKIKEHERSGTGTSEALADIERDWAEKASDARRARTVGGSIAIGIGAVLAGIGTAVMVATAADEEPSSVGFALTGVGAFGIVSGIGALVGESPLERSHRMWKTVRANPEPISNISVGITVLPGGGGAASFALTF